MVEYGRIHTDGSRSGGQHLLLPCPFCGGRAEMAEIETEDLPLWLGECQEPPCEAVAPVRPTRDEAIAAWNTRQPTQSDPEAMRYGFDGFGYKYIDSGSGSDWRTRHPDAEPLYLGQPTQSDAVQAENEALRHDLERQMSIANEHVNEVERLREALEAAPLISAWESNASFMRRQEAWLRGPYHAAMQEQSK